MNAKDLIQLNNKKRKQLNEHNEAYYDKMLVYIRSHLTISEQQSEELLMELLDHLLEAQSNGKTAEEVFGDDPKAYCDELIRQLPKEKRMSAAFFIGYLIFQLAGWMALVKGGIETIAEFFTDLDNTLYLGSAVTIFLIEAVIILLVVAVFICMIKRSVFAASNKVKDFFIAGLAGVIVFACFIFIPKWIPEFGYRIEAGGVVFLILGLIILAVSKWMNKKFRITT
jgi:DNA-binding ferritin-like protein (Dps family)